jgi:hypothetical protein
MSIIQTTATTFPGARQRPAVTPREVRPARWQLSGLLICGVLTLDGRAYNAADGQVWTLEPRWQG